MNTLSPEYMRGFARVCFERGLSEKQAAELFEVAHFHELSEDPDVARGFARVMEKAAGSMFAAMDPNLQQALNVGKSTVTGGVTGGVTGAGLGLASGVGFNLLRKIPRIGKFIPASIPNIGTKGLAYGTAGGGVVGALTGGWNAASKQNPGSVYGPQGPSTNGPWLPDYLNSRTVSRKAAPPSSVFRAPGGFDAGGGGASSLEVSDVQPVAQAREQQKQLAGIDQQIAQLEGSVGQLDPNDPLAGALANNRIRGQLETLRAQRSAILKDTAGILGQVRSDQSRSGASIAAQIKAVEDAIGARAGRAGDAAQWLEGSSGKLLPEMWNSLTGQQNGATQLNSELVNLRAELRRLQGLQKQVSGMLPN